MAECPKPAPRRRPPSASGGVSLKPKSSKKLLVKNLPANCTEDSLELCFESKRKFGRQLSLEEDGVELDIHRREAIICYKTDRDVETVLEISGEQDITLEGEALDIQCYMEEEDHFDGGGGGERFSVVAGSNDDGDAEEEDASGDEDSATVEVTGFHESTSYDTLFYYFSNAKKGGGDILDLSVDREEKKAHIKFKDKKVLGNLLTRDHTVDDQHISVRKFAYSKTELLLKGLTEAISRETLRYFIEAKLVPEIKELVFNEDWTCALVQSRSPIDFGRAVQQCKEKRVEETTLTPCRVPITNCIFVKDIPKVSKDTFKYYFESKESGGRDKDVEKVELHDDENYCLVFFEKPEAVQYVCQQKKHILNNTKMSVCPYHTCLGVPASAESETKFTLPDSVDLSDEDTNKLKFIVSNGVQREVLNEKLGKDYAKMSSVNNTYILECTLTVSVKGCRELAKKWSETALKTLRNHTKEIGVRVKPIDDSARKEILEALQEVDIPDPDKVAVFFPEGSSNLVVVGVESEMHSFLKIMDKTLADVESRIKQARTLVEEWKNVKYSWKVAYLRKKFVDKMRDQYPNLDIILNEEKAQVGFKGKKEEVTLAEIEMFQELQQIQETSQKLGEEKLKLLENEKVKDKLNAIFKSEHIDCVWNIKHGELLLYGDYSRLEFTRILNQIDDFMTKLSIRLDDKKANILKSKAWKDIKQKLLEKCEGCLEIKHQQKEHVLEVYTTENYDSLVSDELDTFFERNAIYEENFKCDPYERKYIMLYKINELKFQPDAKAVEFKKDDILLKGTRAELDAAKRILNNLKRKIISKDDVLTKPGIHGYFECEEGKNCLQRTEKGIPCLIVLQRENRPSCNVKSDTLGKKIFAKPTKCADVKLASGLIVEVFCGDMTELKVDVLVNASNNKLEHAGGLAAVIVKKGGQSIQNECSDRVKSKGQLKAGDVFVSGSGNLPCKAIAHALGPVWKSGTSHEEDNLKLAVRKCLEETEKRNYSSVAIPALSTGAFYYPVKEACSAIVEEIVNKTGMKEVQKVVLCDINETTVKCFVEALQVHTKNVKIHYTFDSVHHGPTWLHTDDAAKKDPHGSDRRTSSGSPDQIRADTKVEVVQEELSKQTVDVIVNSTSKDLRLDHGISSKAISRAAGGDMQKECNKKYPKGIQVGDIAVTNGYKLSCKKVYHIAVETYERGQGALKGLWSVVEHCLNEANKYGVASIAFPPIGCGAQKYPAKEAASTMLNCISKFLEKTPNTSIRTIRLVIYTADADKFEVFMKESRVCHTKSPSRIRSRKQRTNSGQVINITKDSAQFKIDCLDLNIRQGDITIEDADAIVASCNQELDLSKGAVTNALLQKGGDEIQKDCKKQKANMKKDGIAVTKAGQLKTGHIIHIDTKYKTKEWLHSVELCLKKAEDMGLNSIAFPTLGISVGCSPDGIAEMMVEALTNFTKKNTVKKLQEVRIIIFQKKIVSPFIGAMKRCIEGNDSHDSSEDKDGNHHRKSHSASDSNANPASDKIAVKVYAEGESNVEKALKQLKKAVADEWMVSNMKETVLFTMPQNKLDQIKREGKPHNIHVDIDHDLGEIKFHGLVKDMMPVKDKINKIIRDFERSKHEQQQAKLLANIVRWLYLKDQKQYPFPDDINKKIEDAYNRKDAKVRVNDRSGGEYEIDFSSMTEYDVKNTKEKFTVIRRDEMQGASKELPKTWLAMKDSENLKVIDLQQTDPEFQKVQKEFTSSLQRTPTIVKIERIQNQALYTQYAAKRKQLNQQNPQRKDNERVLWHGTAADAVTSINHHGFNRSYCGKNAVAIGNGVYFAVSAAYSDQGTYSPADTSGHKRMYRCLVLTGDYAAGQHGMRTPPAKQGQQSHVLYDSVTNNVSNPAMFVIFHDCQAYPEHIITYK